MKCIFSYFVPHGTLCLQAARATARTTICAFISVLLIAPLNAEQEENVVPMLLSTASDNGAANESLQLALRDMILGWDEMAQLRMQNVLRHNPDSALAYCALMVLGDADAEHAQSKLMLLLSEGYQATPQEMALLTGWLRLVGGDARGAGEEFAEHAEQFRQDILSAAWAIRLLHDGYDSVSGKPLPNQQRALAIASELYARKPHDPHAAYLRAWVEEASPQPSEEAVNAARVASELLSFHPCTHLLYAHLLFRKGLLKEALPHFHLASQRAGELREMFHVEQSREASPLPDFSSPSVLLIRAMLYESTALWLDGQRRQSLDVQAALLKWAASRETLSSVSPEAVLLRWEARTLPLRLLMLQNSLPSDKEVAAASKSALVDKSQVIGEPLSELRDCFRFCLVARQRAAAGQGAQAIRCIKSAEAVLKAFEEARSHCAQQGPYVLSAWTRMHEACRMALLAAKAAAYPDTSDIWLQNLEDCERPTTLLMPPALPHVIQRKD